ncbi:MAG: AI-2E family transporter [Chloroflexi bacterium]|nr:AI-2E family transporter [Chloroflexota bacterium]
METSRWSPQTKFFVSGVLFIILLILLYLFRVLIPPLGAAALLASVVRIPVNYLERRTGLPRGLLTLLTFLLLILLIAVTPALFTTRMIEAFHELRLNLSDALLTLQEWASRPHRLGTLTVVPLQFLGPALESLRGLLTPVAGGVFTVAGRVASILGWGIFIVVVTFWLVKDYPTMFRAVEAQLPPAYREELTRLGREIANTWDAFLKGQFTLALVVGLILSVILWILGMPTPVALGIFSGFMEFIPTFGPLTGWLIAVTLALIQGSSWLPVSNGVFALIITVVYLLVFQLDSVFLIPNIVGQRVRLHPLVVFVGLLAGALTAGVIGALLAAPTIACTRVVLRYVYYKLLDLPPFPPETPLLTPEKGWWNPERARDIRVVLFDLDGTLFETDDAVVERLARFLSPLARLLDVDARRLARRLVMSLEDTVNTLITLLDVLHLDRAAFWLAERADRLLHPRPRERSYTLTDHSRTFLEDLRGRYVLGVVTTRSREEAEAMLRSTGIRDYFDIVITRDDVRRLKPHPAPIRLAAEKLGVEPHQILLVGDTPVDVRAAKAAGALAAAVLCGFGELEELQDADIIVEKPADLWRWI